MAVQESPTPPLLLLPEALGFVPQLLLDDIINIANDSVANGIIGLEGYLQGWANQRAKDHEDWDGSSELEHGLAAVETLLEHHTDVAFDFLEAWSLRNIFHIPGGLPYVLPQQEGLDLTTPPGREQELMDEIAGLRAKLEDQRKIKRLCRRAKRVSKLELQQQAKRREMLSILESPAMDTYQTLPATFSDMYATVSSMGTLDETTTEALSQFHMTEHGKRQWETSETGYLKWAVRQLLARGRPSGGNVEDMAADAEQIGKAEDLRMAAQDL